MSKQSSPYRIDAKSSLKITLNGKQLIAKDKFTCDYLTTATEAIADSDDSGESTVHNFYNAKDNHFRFRRETAVDKYGHLEITARMQLMPFAPVKEQELDYCVDIPFSLVEGGTYQAWSGKSGDGRSKIIKGHAGESLIDVRYIAFTGGEMDLVIDFNACGITDWMDYCKWGSATARWKLEKDGDYLKLSSPHMVREHGGTYGRKILLYEGPWDFEQRHPYDTFSYTGQADPQLRLGFGSASKTIADAGTQSYTPEKKQGWLNNDHLQLKPSETPTLRNGNVSASSKATFQLDVTPGYYIIPISCINTENIAGPFNIDINGQQAQSDIRLEKNQRGEFILHCFAREGKITLDFSGENWCISSLSLKTLIYENEDFVFDRGFWHNMNLPDFLDDKCPTNMREKFTANK